MTTTPFATEAGHWYDKAGTPAYEVPKTSSKVKCPTCGGSLQGSLAKARTAGCEVCDAAGYVYPENRPTTLTDARKLDLAPSVTGVIRVMASPALERYRLNQFAQAAWTAPKDVQELDYEAWVQRVEADAKEHARQAASRGTEIHATMEKGLQGFDLTDYIHRDWFYLWRADMTRLLGTWPIWEAERSFTHKYGYGCKVDAVWRPSNGAGVVLDFKTKDFGDKLPEVADEHLMQLAANRMAAGIPQARGFIVFLDRTEPKVHIVETPEADLDKGMRMFLHCLKLWQYSNNWRPSWTEWSL